MSQSQQPRLIIVTGVSGAGHTTAMRVLEDLGYYCVDNLPVALAPTVVRLARESGKDFAGVALGIDSRERIFFAQWPAILAALERDGTRPEVLFLDASDEVLARRYSETRRPHPLSHSGKGIVEMIREDRSVLAEMKERASCYIDSTALTVHELRERVTAAVMGSATGDRMAISIVSFGYKYGAPLGLDLMLDVRFIPNPFFLPEFKPLSGLDRGVHEWVMKHPESQQFIDEVGRLLDFLIPLYRREGKSYLTIGLGCTGGRHRSPALSR
ncbi:MAG TPA: RNase adapter RapZ, partial [Candidatus Binataceae bacterium]|nr:RNase adapter RapZ [Candidatus Binataceae bacterium]